MLLARVAALYRGCGRFAAHYVVGKLRHDPLTAALLALAADEGFGEVADLGCGRGQFAALLLEAGAARRVVGLECRPGLLAQARQALAGLAFEGRVQDLAVDSTVPPVDTVLILDVLYQLPTAAQLRLLEAAAGAARRRVVIRTADPALRLRGRLTRLLERAARPVWPHSGSLVNARPVDWIADRLQRLGWSISVAPCWAGTPFSNVLLTAWRATAGPASALPGGASGR